MKKKLISLLCMMSLLVSFFSFMIPVYAQNEIEIIERGEIPLLLHYDEEAPYGNENASARPANTADDGWEKWSLPIGNGYFGANVFGRTVTERIQITEKTLANPYYRKDATGTNQSLGGLNNFSETYIDFGHTNSAVEDYSRWLDLETAISGVSYVYNGVTYTREYFTSYPDKALIIRLDANTAGALNFTLRPTVPWQQDYAVWEGDRASKEGSVVSKVTDGVGEIELFGKMGYYDIDFLGIYKVFTNGGTVSAGISDYTYTDTAGVSHTDTNGIITVSEATSAYIVVTLGTDYELTEEVFTSADSEKPTFNTTLEDARVKVEGDMNAILDKIGGKNFDEAYNTLKIAHVADYSELFSRVTLDLGSLEDAALTTDELLKKYQNGDYSPYLEALYFQYGRYLLIASSREGALPANLQGTWNRYNFAPWASGYWHNINVQMNYWHAFSTNLTETFLAYADYNEAYMPAAEANASSIIAQYNASKKGLDGGDGWCIGTSAFPNEVNRDRSAGNLGFTTQLFWEYYDYTRDSEILESVYELLVSAARFITKTVELTEEGYYLVSHSDSPEMYVNGVWYYTVGTTYAQTFAYINNYNALAAAKELGVDFADTSREDCAILSRILEQIDKYDPINVGLSGQIKEFREEDYYASVADDPNHRHISQLVGLYPGNLINSTTEAWLDAAIVTLTNRGDKATGWGMAHRLNLWARTKQGNRTYQVLNKLLSEGTTTNLWDMCPPFQIDGNFGGTAGITEMLLQSHEGYIEPLAAIPTAWQSGSYTGLVARGNFEVSAKWENGMATVFNIISRAGERASVFYSGISSATVTTASGKRVEFDIDGKNLISFDTEVGETYIISGFTVPREVENVSAINAERYGLGPVDISWSAVSGIAGYNLYIAINNDADYTLLTSTAATKYTYTPTGDNINSRFTFKVKAFDSEGNESDGAICYINPIDTEAYLEEYEANVLVNNELQVIVKATENTKLYKLWRLSSGEGEYSLVCESKYPILICEDYCEKDKYAVSLVSNLLDDESERYEITKFRSESASSEMGVTGWVSNILLGTSIVPNPNAPTSIYSSSYGYDKLTDGGMYKQPDGSLNQHASRYSAKTATDVMDGTIYFGKTYLVGEVRLYDYTTSSTSTRLGDLIEIYLYTDGVWTKAASLDKNGILSSKIKDSAESVSYVSVNLGYAAADAMRIVCSNITATQAITIYEITATGIVVEDNKIQVDNVLEGLQFSGNLAPFSASYGYDKLTDGSFDSKSGRFALIDEGDQTLVLECNLGEAIELYTLSIYDWCDGDIPRIKSIKVEVYNGSEWIVAASSVTPLAKNKRSHDGSGFPVVIELGGAKAGKIRITASNAADSSGISIYEISCSGKKANDGNGNNILADKSFVGSDKVVGTTYGYAALTDGKFGLHDGRFALQPTESNMATFESDLGALYELHKLKIYDWCDSGVPRISSLSVEVYYCGEWIKVIDGATMTPWSERVSDAYGKATVFNLGGVKGEKIRINCIDGSGKGISIYEISCSGVKSSGECAGTNAFADNIKSLSVGKSSVYSSFPLENAFDGKLNTRYALSDNSSSYVLEIELEKVKELYTLNIYDFRNPTDCIDGKKATRSNSTYIELYINGTWIRVVDGVSMTVDKPYTSFYLYGFATSKIRIGFNNTRTFDDGSQPSATIYEITCSAAAEIVDRKPLLEIYQKLDAVAYGNEDHDEKMKRFYSYLSAFDLDAGTMATRSAEMTAYYEEVKDNVIPFVPKTSITLGSELVYNVYIPVVDYLKSFTVDGKTHSNAKIVTLDDGNQYYHIAVPMAASEAARNVVLKATVTVDGKDYKGTWTMSITKYAKSVIESGTAEEVTLVKDVLAYIRAAYVYFDKYDKDEAITAIDGILGTYERTFEKILGETNTEEGLKSVIIVLNEKPVIRFILPEGKGAEDYTFKCGNKTLEYTTGTVTVDGKDHAYVELKLYAYQLIGEIAYTDGTYSGSFHINSYYEFVTTDEAYKNNTALITLVEKLYNYCKSAEAYRASVTNN